MSQAEKVVEYLCFACGSQGMVKVPAGEGKDGRVEPVSAWCPNCHRRVATFEFRLQPSATGSTAGA